MPGDVAVVPETNPWAAYGLNPDGTPVKAEEPKKEDPIQAELTSVKTKLADAEAKLAKLPGDFEGLTKKMEVVDRLVKALGGGDVDPKTQEYKQIWEQIKETAKVASPNFYKQMIRAEQNPDAADATERTANALAQARLADLNTRAHDEVMGLAKGVFRGFNADELAEAVYPFEMTMTEMINQNPELSRRFVNGDMSIVKEMFQRLAKPHVAGRLRQKQAQTREKTFPSGMPKGGGTPQAGEGDSTVKPDIRTRAGREQFHKAAVGRFMDRRTQDNE